jgi:hypothetical protein
MASNSAPSPVSEGNEIVRIGQALASAQMRARESQKRAVQAEGLLRAVVSAVEDGPDANNMLSSRSMQEWDLLQSFSTGLERSPSFTGSQHSDPSAGEDEKTKTIEDSADVTLFGTTEIRTTNTAHFTASSHGYPNNRKRSHGSGSALTLDSMTPALPEHKILEYNGSVVEKKEEPSKFGSPVEYMANKNTCLELQTEDKVQVKPVLAQPKPATTKSQSSEKRPLTKPANVSAFGNFLSWGNVVQLLAGIVIGWTIGSIMEKRITNQRVSSMKAEITHLVEQVRRLQMTNEINQIYGSGLRTSATVASSTMKSMTNEAIDVNGAVSIMSFWAEMVASSAAEIS